MVPPAKVKVTKCKFYNPETGNPDPHPCPRSANACWYIHPSEPEWGKLKGKVFSSPPKGFGGRGRKGSMNSRIGRGRSRSRAKSKSRTRSKSRGRGARGRSRSRSSSGRYVSPGGRRPRHSPPVAPRRPLHERLQRSPRRRSRSRQRSSSPHRHQRNRRRLRARSPTPISSSRGPTPHRDSKLPGSPRRIKAEPSADAVPGLSSNPTHAVLSERSGTAGGGRIPVAPRGSVDQLHQRPVLELPLGRHDTATTESPQPASPLVDPQSPVFAPETPDIPGLSTSFHPVQSDTTSMVALQRSLQQVIRDQTTTKTTRSPNVPSGEGSAVSRAATIPDAEKTEIWTARVKLWADLMRARSEVADWQEEVKLAQSFKNRSGFESLSQEAQAQIDSRVTYATMNLVQHQLAFEAIVSQSIALDRSVSKTNAALAPASTGSDPQAATPREVEWMQDKIQSATSRMDDLERKIALQDELLAQIKAEEEAIVALPPLTSTAHSRSSADVDDRDGVLANVPSLKRKRTEDDDHRPSRRKPLARTIQDLREAHEALIDRVAEAEGTIEGVLNDVVEEPDGEESSRVTRLKEIVQDYQVFTESAKTAAEDTERNSRVVEVLRAEAERVIADWNEAYQEFEVARNEATDIHNREKERLKAIKEKEERIDSMQREVDALNITIQGFVEQQSAQPEAPLTLELVIQTLKPYLLDEMREVTQPLLNQHREELESMLRDHIEAVRVSVYEPMSLSEQVAKTMVNWLEAEFAFGNTRNR